MNNQHWFLIENDHEYNLATKRYEEIKAATKGSAEQREKLLLAHLISEYESNESELPDVDPVEMIKIRTEDFGYL